MFGVLGIAAFTAGPWYGAAASAMSVLLFDCLFVPPLFSLSVYDLSYFITFTLMFLVALSASALTSRTQAQAQQSIRRATYTELMLTNSRRLQQAENEEAMLTEAMPASFVRCWGVTLYATRCTTARLDGLRSISERMDRMRLLPPCLPGATKRAWPSGL